MVLVYFASLNCVYGWANVTNGSISLHCSLLFLPRMHRSPYFIVYVQHDLSTRCLVFIPCHTRIYSISQSLLFSAFFINCMKISYIVLVGRVWNVVYELLWREQMTFNTILLFYSRVQSPVREEKQPFCASRSPRTETDGHFGDGR